MNESLDGSSCNIPKEWLEDDDRDGTNDADSFNCLKPTFDSTFHNIYGNEKRYKTEEDDEDHISITKPTTMADLGLYQGSTFNSHSEIESQVLNWGKNIGIVDLSVHTSKKRKDDDIFPYEYYVFKCSQRNHRGCDCGFRLRYAFSKTLNKIVIKSIMDPDGSIHDNSTGAGSFQSNRFVNSVKDLTYEEIMYLKEVAPDRPNLIRLKSTLNRLFPNRLFDRHLLRRVLTKGLNDYLGSDKDSASKFMQYGDRLIRDGGIFEKKACAGSLRFTTIHMQHKLEKELSEVYGKRFVSIDTTFNISCHDMKVLPYIAVDCLCKNCPVGFSFMEVENASDIVEGFRILNIGTKGMQVGCDNGTAIICALNELGMNAAHDGWHYHKSGKLAARNMGPLRNAFLADLYKVIYHDFHEDKDLDDYMRTMMKTYNVNEKMNSFLIGLWKSRQNLCKTYVSENFVLTFGKGAQVRSEQFNSYMKKDLKGVMTQWKLFEFTNHIDYLRRSYESTCLQELEDLIEKGKMISDKITKKVEECLVRANCYNVLPGSHSAYHPDRHLNGTLHYVEAKMAQKKRLHLVFVPDDISTYPSCSCRGFKSTEVPCAHIARVFFEPSMKERNLFDKSTFAPYWHIDNHPLFIFAKGSESGESSCSKIPCDQTNNQSEKEEVREMVLPTSLNTRRGVLHGVCQYIVEHGIQGNDNFLNTLKELETIKWNVTQKGDKRKSVSDRTCSITNKRWLVPRPPTVAKRQRNEKEYNPKVGKKKYEAKIQELKIEKIAAGVPDYDIDVDDM